MFGETKRGYLGLVAAVGLALASWFLGRPAYHAWRERHTLVQARAFLAKSDYGNAILAARKALVYNRDNADACRILAGITELIRSPAALEWRRRVIEIEPDNPTNQLQLASTALQLAKYSQAAAALEAVPPTLRKLPDYLRLSALLAVSRNDLEGADLQLSEAARLDPENKQILINRAVLGLQSTNETLTTAAISTLQGLAKLPEFRADALRQLAQAAFRGKNWPRALEYSRELTTLTNALFEDQLLRLSVLKDSGDAAFPAQLRAVEQVCQTAAPLASGLSYWLLAQKQIDEAATWLATLPPAVQEAASVRFARADVALARQDWPGLRALAEGGDWKESEFLRYALLARAARESGADLEALTAWRNALVAVKGKGRQLALLARIATDWGWKREQAEALWTLVQQYPSERWAVPTLTQLYLGDGNTLGLQKLYTTLLDRNPDDLIAGNNLATVCLLLNLQTDRAHDLARSVYQKAGTNEVFASTYAYSLHLQGRTAEGLKVLSALPPTALAHPAVALYYGALLSVAAPEKARPVLAIAANGTLLPEEKELLATARKRL